MPPTFMKTLLRNFSSILQLFQLQQLFIVCLAAGQQINSKRKLQVKKLDSIVFHFKSELTQMSLCSLQRIKKLVPSYSHHNICCNNNLNRFSRGEKKYTETVVHFCLIKDYYKMITHYRWLYVQMAI